MCPKYALHFPCILLAADLWLLHMQNQHCSDRPAQTHDNSAYPH